MMNEDTDCANPHVLLDPVQMGRADRAAMALGVSGSRLMEAAGQAVARAIMSRWRPMPVLVLCGPGNNGGDGFVIARCLQAAAWPVRVALWGDAAALRGDAAWAAGTWPGPVESARAVSLRGARLVVDALLGAGLNRPPGADMAGLIQAVNAARQAGRVADEAQAGGRPAAVAGRAAQAGLPATASRWGGPHGSLGGTGPTDHAAVDGLLGVCAVDVPTGLDGATGQCPGAAIQADLTVTFFRCKPGHVLWPGRRYCGVTQCAAIGIPDQVLAEIAPRAWVNHPDLWRAGFPWPQPGGHKYRRGHALVVGGDTMLGASRLACLAAARVGAGLVTLATPPAAWPVQAGALTSVLVEALPADGGLDPALADARRNALLIGPGLGRTDRARRQVLAALATGRPCVLDADALSAFADAPADLLDALHARCVLTPHDGEFARVFQTDGDKCRRARAAAARSGAVIVLKGPDTVIAAPDGRCVINDNAPPTLATAGTGDVLAGCLVGLLAAGMPVFQAACAAVWLHGQAAGQLGWGLLAEDLPAVLPGALAALAAQAGPGVSCG
ncbi:NAD(P)H-hydrate dehydratase [Castellaniella hirudinis]|uniref:NAD(P)H-hydrate dehydratase n=1 Tax=Castellaniella hirudinis TaxID=1144617 RepID=UPI0039C0EDEC